MSIILFDQQRYTVCGVRLVYHGRLAVPTQGDAEFRHPFRQHLTLPRRRTGRDIIAEAVEEGVLIFPTGIIRTEREYGGNPQDRVIAGTAWLVFGFADNVSVEAMDTFGRRVDIVLTERQFQEELQRA